MKGHDFMHNTTMPLNVMELLYGVIPMALVIFFILSLKYKLPLFYNEDLFIKGPHS
jgi:hypothetical protein